MSYSLFADDDIFIDRNQWSSAYTNLTSAKEAYDTWGEPQTESTTRTEPFKVSNAITFQRAQQAGKHLQAIVFNIAPLSSVTFVFDNEVPSPSPYLVAPSERIMYVPYNMAGVQLGVTHNPQDDEDYQMTGIKLLDSTGKILNEIVSCVRGDEEKVDRWLEPLLLQNNESITGVKMELNGSVPTQIDFTVSSDMGSNSLF